MFSLQAPPNKVKFQIVSVVKVLTSLQWHRFVSVHDGENFLSTGTVAETAVSKERGCQQLINRKDVDSN